MVTDINVYIYVTRRKQYWSMSGMFLTNLALMNWQSSNLLALVQIDNSNVLQQIIWPFNGWILNRDYLNELFTVTFGHWCQCLQFAWLIRSTIDQLKQCTNLLQQLQGTLNYDFDLLWLFQDNLMAMYYITCSAVLYNYFKVTN